MSRLSEEQMAERLVVSAARDLVHGLCQTDEVLSPVSHIIRLQHLSLAVDDYEKVKE